MSPAVLAGLTAAVVSAFVERNRVPPAEVPVVIDSVATQLSALAAGRTPALSPARRSGRART